MATAQDGTGTPSGQPNAAAAGAGDTTTQNQPPNSGARADTSRVGDGQGATPKDGDQKTADGKVYTFKEDCADWVPRGRLNEESGKAKKFEGEIAQLRNQLEDRDKKLRAALGIETPSPEEQEIAEARGAGNGKDRGGTLEDEVADALHVEKLNESQKRRLRVAFREEARDAGRARQKAEDAGDAYFDFDNDFVARYERGDKTLLTEFAKTFLDEWVTPVRRQNVASAVQRQNRPVPRGEDRK